MLVASISVNVSRAALASVTEIQTLTLRSDVTPFSGVFEQAELPPGLGSTVRLQELKNLQWRWLKEDIPNLGFSKETVRLRVRVRNDSNDNNFVLYFADPHYNLVEISMENPQTGSMETQTAGLKSDHNARRMKVRGYAFPVAMLKGEERTLYIALQSEGAMKIAASLYSTEAFAAHTQSTHLFAGLYYGIALIMILHNLFLFLILKEENYLFYSVYAFTTVAFLFADSGYGYSLLWTEYGWAKKHIFTVLAFLASATMAFFTLHFYETGKNAKKMNAWLYVLTALGLMGALLTTPLYGVVINNLASGYSLVTMLSIGAFSMERWLSTKQTAAMYFMLAFCSVVAGGVIFFLENSGVLPSNIVTSNGLRLGAILEIALLSFALGERISKDKKAKILAQAALIQVQELAHKEQTETNESLRRFVPQEFINMLHKQTITQVGMGDHVEAHISVMFLDIRGFTKLSERLSPQETFQFINEYLSCVAPAIRRHSGFIDKYLGDCIMAIFPRLPSDALCAATDVFSSLSLFNQQRAVNGDAPVNVAAGLHYGMVTMGTVGYQHQMQATVIGDAVNIAARLEGVAKEHNARLVVSEQFVFSLAVNHENLTLESLGPVTLRGRAGAITAFKVLDVEEAQEESIPKVA